MVANIFAQIMARRGKLAAQSRVNNITRQMTRLTKLISRNEKQIASEKRAAINNAKMANNSVFGSAGLMSQIFSTPSQFGQCFTGDGNYNYQYLATDEGKQRFSELQKWQAQQQQMGQMTLNFTLQQIEDYYDALMDSKVEALKEEQADLEAEKATAEAEVKMYEGMEQEQKQFADANIKSQFGGG